MTSRALLLTPSRGAGGGIERYAEALEWAFSEQGVSYQRIDLEGSSASAHFRMLSKARDILRMSASPTRLILAHRALLPVAYLLSKERSFGGISVVCHGIDVWGRRPVARRLFERHIMRGSAVRVVAGSSFTAGALTETCRASVLPPGLPRHWFDTLVNESSRARGKKSDLCLLTTFRLGQWRGKGLRELLDGVAALGRSDIRVTVCGSGQPSPELQHLVAQHHWCALRPGVTDRELAQQFAEADLFILASRTKRGRHPSGEGFGLVLLEAQVAGTPVVGPAFGGSRDAYIDGVTGLTPADETAESLASLLDSLLQDPCRLAQMAKQAAEWSRASFDPELYARRAVARLL
jgi:phosphatidyl-myo-inositol dimannoside synthase